MLQEWGRCQPYFELDEQGNWSGTAMRVTKSGESFTVDEFSTVDCSGPAAKTTPGTCGECTDLGDSYFIINCDDAVGDEEEDDEQDGEGDTKRGRRKKEKDSGGKGKDGNN